MIFMILAILKLKKIIILALFSCYSIRHTYAPMFIAPTLSDA